jgi:hypothetical protein
LILVQGIQNRQLTGMRGLLKLKSAAGGGEKLLKTRFSALRKVYQF